MSRGYSSSLMRNGVTPIQGLLAIPGLVYLYNAEHSPVTLFSGGMLASGTSPVAVTISGTLTRTSPVKIRIDTGGTRGVATFSWSIDEANAYTAWNGPFTTAATVALSGIGITAAFPSGTYNTNNTWESVVGTWGDLSTNALHVDNGGSATNNAPLWRTVPGGVRGMLFDASSRFLRRASGGLTGNPTHSIFARINYSAAGIGNAQGVAGLGLSTTTGNVSSVGVTQTGALYGGGVGLTTPTGGAISVGTSYTIGKTHAATTQLYLAGVAVGSAVARTHTLSAGVSIGRTSTSSGACACNVRTALAVNRVLSGAELAQVVAWLDAA